MALQTHIEKFLGLLTRPAAWAQAGEFGFEMGYWYPGFFSTVITMCLEVITVPLTLNDFYVIFM